MIKSIFYGIIFRWKWVISMKIPNLKDAKVRTRNKSITKENEYILNDNLRVLGKGKTYFV